MTARRRTSERGAALVLVFMIAAVFFILMGTLIDALAIESQNTIESADSNAALTAAYSGVNLQILAIEEYFQNGVQNGPFPTETDCNFSSPNGNAVSTTCHAEVMKAWNGSGSNYYLIDSTGLANPSEAQEVQRTVQAMVKEVPFGAYAMFTETEATNTGDNVWYSSGQQFGGPVYSGGNMHIRYNSGDANSPIFPDGFTTSGAQGNVKWYDVVDGDGTQPNTPQEYASVFGSSVPSYVSSGVALPGLSQNLVVFSEAYYGDATHDTAQDLGNANQTPGVYVNGGDPSCPSGILCSGIFVQGDAQIKSSAVASPNGDLASGSETWTIDPANGTHFTETTVTVNFAAGTTTVTTGSNVATYTGLASGEAANGSLANGAIFVNGNLTVADGSVVHGQYTLAVPDPPQQASQNMTLTGSLTYSSDPSQGASQDELALWADTIWLRSTDANVTVDGMVLTGYANECTDSGCGGYFANYYCKRRTCNGSGTGNLNLDGAVIENMRGKMGEANPQGGIQSGYLRTFNYDPRLGANPPPFSPTTNLYSIVALQDRGMLCLMHCPTLPSP